VLHETPIEELEKEVFVENVHFFLDRRSKTTRAKFIDTRPYYHLCSILHDIRQRFPVEKASAVDRRRLGRIADPLELFQVDKDVIEYAC
jgi:hypothetical protein